MSKVFKGNLHMALVGIYHHLGTYRFCNFWEQNSGDFKFNLGQDHSSSFYHIIISQQLRCSSSMCSPQVSGSKQVLLANKLKTRRVLNYKLGT